MPNITNAAAITFCNEMVRPHAGTYIKLYLEAVKISDTWNAQGLSAVITNDSSIIEDTAATGSGDGRPIITGQLVTDVITQAENYVTLVTANSNAILNIMLAIAVVNNPVSQAGF